VEVHVSARRVVVTGIGLVTPLGIGTEETWRAAISGVSGIGPITLFDTTDFATKFAGEVKGFEPTAFIEDKREAKWMDRFLHFGFAASKIAFQDSGITVTEANAERIGAYIGSGLSGVATIERTHAALKEKGPRRGISP
jgi:3-oxoacyl-[acyl-carrier-protein] synthase II